MKVFRILALIFTVVPLIELILFWKVGAYIGFPATIVTILVTGMLGAWLTRKQGFRTIAQYQKAISELRLPHREVVDGILILLAGALLLTPGFLTDLTGFALLIPPLREKVRNRIMEKLGRKLVNLTSPRQKPASGAGDDDVITIDSEVIEEKIK